jgi:F420H(2)-dependent quinone reductase
VGRRTGQPHTIAISYGEVPGGWSIVASNGGSDREPHWLLNLRASPSAVVHVGRRRVPIVADVLQGPAKAGLWEEIVARAPVYGRYQAGTARDIAVVVLRPVGA